jgi:hypothetical protein
MLYMPFALMLMPYFSEFMHLCFNAISIQIDLPNIRLKLQGLGIFGRASVSFSLWFGALFPESMILLFP